MVVHQPNMVVVVVVLGSAEKYHIICSHNNLNYSHKFIQMYSIIPCGSWYFHCCVGFVMVLNLSDSNGGGGRRRRGQQRMRWLDGITDSMEGESEWTRGVSDGQGGLACCNSWGHKESDTTERLNWTELTGGHNFNWNYGVFVVVKYIEHMCFLIQLK